MTPERPAGAARPEESSAEADAGVARPEKAL